MNIVNKLIQISFINILLIVNYTYVIGDDTYYSPIPETIINRHFKDKLSVNITVLPVENKDKYFSDRIEGLMLKIGHNVISRNEIEKIIKEHNLSLSGLLDKDNAEMIGKISNIYGIILCHLDLKSEYCYIKYIDLKTATVVYTCRFEGGTTWYHKKGVFSPQEFTFKNLMGKEFKTFCDIMSNSFSNAFLNKLWEELVNNEIITILPSHVIYKKLTEYNKVINFYTIYFNAESSNSNYNRVIKLVKSFIKDSEEKDEK